MRLALFSAEGLQRIWSPGESWCVPQILHIPEHRDTWHKVTHRRAGRGTGSLMAAGGMVGERSTQGMPVPTRNPNGPGGCCFSPSTDSRGLKEVPCPGRPNAFGKDLGSLDAS